MIEAARDMQRQLGDTTNPPSSALAAVAVPPCTSKTLRVIARPRAGAVLALGVAVRAAIERHEQAGDDLVGARRARGRGPE